MLETISPQDYIKLYGGQAEKVKRNKYNNVKVKYDGHTFDSKREYRRYLMLMDMQKKGEISNLEVHVKYEFPLTTQTGKNYSYEADFRYRERVTGLFVIEDSKGHRTEVYKLKRALMKHFFNIEVREV